MVHPPIGRGANKYYMSSERNRALPYEICRGDALDCDIQVQSPEHAELLRFDHMILDQHDEAAVGNLVADCEGRQTGDPQSIDGEMDQRVEARAMTEVITAADNGRFLLAGLLALATAGFVTILTEALPAGLLPQIGTGLSVSEALAGQLVTIYAAGSLVVAIPLTAAT